MAIKKATKAHTSSRKKASALSATKRLTKKATTKVTKRARKSEIQPNISEAEWVKLGKLTLKVFQTVYDDFQEGKFRRLF